MADYNNDGKKGGCRDCCHHGLGPIGKLFKKNVFWGGSSPVFSGSELHKLSKKVCFKCGQLGHLMKDYPRLIIPCKKKVRCERCMRKHLTSECEGERVCFNCNKQGHTKKRCPKPYGARLEKRPIGECQEPNKCSRCSGNHHERVCHKPCTCFECGQAGHQKKDCPNVRELRPSGLEVQELAPGNARPIFHEAQLFVMTGEQLVQLSESVMEGMHLGSQVDERTVADATL